MSWWHKLSHLIMHCCHLVAGCSNTNRLKQWTMTAAKFNQWFLLVAEQGQCCFYLISLLFIVTAPVEWHLQIACQRYMNHLTPLKVSKTRPYGLGFQPRGCLTTWNIMTEFFFLIQHDITSCFISFCPNICSCTKPLVPLENTKTAQAGKWFKMYNYPKFMDKERRSKGESTFRTY